MQQKTLIIIGVAILVLGAGGWFYLSLKSQNIDISQPEQKNAVTTEEITPSDTTQSKTEKPKELSITEKITASSFAEKILKFMKNHDYGKIYNLLTDEDKAAESKTEYVKRVTETSGNISITNWQIKEVLEEPNGASIQYVVNYESILGSGSETGILTLVQKNGKWFLSIGSVDVSRAIIKGVGDEIVLSTIKFKVNSVREQQTISSQYSSASAREGTKLVVVDLSITNTSKTGFYFPTEAFVLTDNEDRKFETYSNTIGNIDNYLNVQELSPSIPEKGVVVYEIPTNATGYSFIVAKSGTDEIYKIVLK